MKLTKLLSTAAVILTTAFPSVTAAAMTPSAAGALSVRALAAKDVRIIQTSARHKGKGIVVDGHLQRKKAHGRVIPRGHVDIAIIDGSGMTIHQTATKVSPEIIPRLDGEKASFTTLIPVQVPDGGYVRVQFHSGPHES